MTENKNLDKKILISIFIFGMILLVAVIFVIIADSPKYSYPKNDYKTDLLSDIEISSLNSDTSDKKFESEVFPIKINTADSEELQLIPNVGPVTANLIIEYRNEYGTIIDFEELLSIDGIGEKTVELLKEYCIIN